MDISVKNIVKETLKDLPTALQAIIVSRDGTIIHSNVDKKIEKQILKLFKKHKDIPVNDYEPETIDENNLLFYGLTSECILAITSTLSIAEILVHSRKTIEKLQKKLGELLKSFVEKLSEEVDEETKQKYNTIYTLSPKYKDIKKILSTIGMIGKPAAMIVANLDKKLPVWQLTLLLKKAGINITFQETQEILDFLHKRGYVTPIKEK
nr:hypothetical protein [Candidatus Baldrarchaeota archaeon]